MKAFFLPNILDMRATIGITMKVVTTAPALPKSGIQYPAASASPVLLSSSLSGIYIMETPPKPSKPSKKLQKVSIGLHLATLLQKLIWSDFGRIAYRVGPSTIDFLGVITGRSYGANNLELSSRNRSPLRGSFLVKSRMML